MSKRIYTFEPLLGSDKVHVQGDVLETYDEDFLKAFYLIIESFKHNGRQVLNLVKEYSIIGELLLLNIADGRIGTSVFNIPTDLTLDATSAAIEKEIDRFRNMQRKETADDRER